MSQVLNFLKSLLTILIIMVPTFYFGYLGRPTEMGIGVLAGALSAAFIHIDKFERFKGAGFEAEMKKVVQEAYATIEQLRKMGKPLIVSIMNMLVFHDKLGSISSEKEHNFFKQLVDISVLLSLEEDADVRSAKELFTRFHVWDHYIYFIRQLAKEEGTHDICKQLEKFRNYESTNYPTRDKIEEIINPIKGSLSSATIEYLEDYYYYKEKQELRRKESIAK